MARDIKDLDDAIDEQSDLIRELGRTPGCEIRVADAQNVLDYMNRVRILALEYSDLGTLLNTR